MRSKIQVILISTLAATASSLAMADAIVNVKSEIVRYDDLRLSSRVGAAVLYARLKGAAERACGSYDSPQLGVKARYQSCIDKTLEAAVRDVNNPIMTEYWESKRGATVPAGTTTPSPTAVAKAR